MTDAHRTNHIGRDRWFRVEVSDHEGQIVAIESEMLTGREIRDAERETIVEAINHLSGFVGRGYYSTENAPPVPESAPLTPDLIEAWRTMLLCERPAEEGEQINALCDMALRCGSATAEARVNDAKFQGATGACAHFIAERDKARQRVSELESELATARRDALEQAAKVCDERIEKMKAHTNPDGLVTGPDFYFAEICAVELCAAAIRAMVPK